MKKPKINLFDNDSDEAEDDFFATKNLEVKKEKTQEQVKTNIENKKTDLKINRLLNETKETTAPARNLPTLSLFPEDDDEDLDKIFEKKTDEKQATKDSKKILEKNVPALNLFSEEDDEDLDKIFDKKAATKESSKESTILEKNFPALNLFAEENDEPLDNIFEKNAVTKHATKLDKNVPTFKLFSEEEDEALDKILKKKSVKEQPSRESTIVEKNIPENNEAVDVILERKTAGEQATQKSTELEKNVATFKLFAEEDDKILEKKVALKQSTQKSSILEKNAPAIKLFPEENDEDLDKISEETTETTKLEKNVPTFKLFAEEEDEDLDKIFANKTATESDFKFVQDVAINATSQINHKIENVEQINNEIENSTEELNAKNVEAIENQTEYSEFADAEDDKLIENNNNNVETTKASITDNAKLHQYANIFSEEPPDDDDFFSVATAKQNETPQRDFFEPASILSTNVNTTQTSEVKAKTIENIDYSGFSLFSDIPPDDDFLDKPAQEQVQQYDSCIDETQQVAFTEELRNDMQETSKAAAAGKDVADKSSIVAADGRTISKLQMPQIKINVQALLPNAAGLSKMRKSLEQQQERKAENNEYLQETQQMSSENLIVSTVKDTNEHILSNVCKGRVRAPLKRRPSTRTARQENYRQTIVAATAEEKSYAEAAVAENTTTDLKKDWNSKAEELQNDLFSASTATDAVFKTPESYLNEDLFSALNKHTEATATKQNIEKHFEKIAKKTATETSAEAKNNMFPTTSKKEIYVKKTLKSMDNDDDDDDDLFFNTAVSLKKPTPTATTKVLPVESNEISKSSLFDDSDDADFDASLFGATSLQKPKVLTTLPQQQSETFTKNKSKSLFFDEDNNSDDDLFKSLKPSNKIAAKSIKPDNKLVIKSSSLFGSDDDDDEVSTDKSDNFFAAVKLPTTAKMNASVSSRLFDENIDEDDDLFSSTNTTFRTQKPTTSIAKRNNVKKQSSITDNPLADLL